MARISTPDESVQPSTPASPNGKTILIAEDDPFISRMYETKLRFAGYTVIVKNNGRDAYEQVKQQKPDLIILDINMPELNGFEVLTALQNDGVDLAALPIVMLTNSGAEDDRQQAKKFGVDYFVKAEMTPREVVDKINQRLA